MLTFDVNLQGLEDQLDALNNKAKKAARLASKAGAAVYYNAIKSAAPKSARGHWFQGTSAKKAQGTAAKQAASYWFESGSLKGAVYQVFCKESTLQHPEYQIAWNHRKVPYGFMVAFGTKHGTRPNNFVAKGGASVAGTARQTMLAKFDEVLNER